MKNSKGSTIYLTLFDFFFKAGTCKKKVILIHKRMWRLEKETCFVTWWVSLLCSLHGMGSVITQAKRWKAAGDLRRWNESQVRRRSLSISSVDGSVPEPV